MEGKAFLNIVLYPQRYNRRGEANLHSVQGSTRNGEIVNVKLRIDPEYQSFPNAPSIQEFARNDIKARNPCLSNPNNSPENREGVLLFTGCTPDGQTKSGIKSYVAKWAVVLASDSESPDPVFGYGRLAIRKDTAAIRKAQSILSNKNSSEEDRGQATRDIENPENYVYPAIFYYAEEMASLTIEDTAVAIEKAIEAHHGHGVTGGALIRIPGTNFAKEYFAHYKANDSKYQSGKEAAETILKDLPLSPGQMVEVVPLARINSGPKGNKHYSSETNLRAIKNLYYQDQDTPQICEVVARVTRYEDTDNTLLYRLYPISAAIANQHTIGSLPNASDNAELKPRCYNVSVPETPMLMGRGERWQKILSPLTVIKASYEEDAQPDSDTQESCQNQNEICSHTQDITEEKKEQDSANDAKINNEKKAATGMAAYLSKRRRQ